MRPRARSRSICAFMLASKKKTIIALIAIVCSLITGHGLTQESSSLFAATTLTQYSGLLDYLLPLVTQKTGISVKVLALGTGQALDAGRRGEADVVFVDAKWAEAKFVADGE